MWNEARWNRPIRMTFPRSWPSSPACCEEHVDTALRRAADLAVATVPSCDAAGVSIAHDGQITTSVATNEFALRIDSHQYAEDQGPCLQAVRTGEIYRIDSMAGETRWPKFTPKAAAEGVVASLSLPLTVRGHVLGALNLYAQSMPFDDHSQQVARLFAVQAAVALATAQTYTKTRELVENLNQALESRDVIGQAKGILMAAQHCDADQAFDFMRQASQRENVKLRDIAQRIADSATKSSPTDHA